MSIMHCDKHDVNYDTDFVEECFKCEQDEIQEETTDLEEKVERLNELNEDDAMEREHFPVESPNDDRLPSDNFNY